MSWRYPPEHGTNYRLRMNTRPRAIPALIGILAAYFISQGIYELMLIGSCSTPAGPGETPCPPGSEKFFFMLFFGILVAMGTIFAGGSYVSFAAIFAGIGYGAIRAGMTGGGEGWFVWFGLIFLASPLFGLVSVVVMGVTRMKAARLMSTGIEATGTVLSIEDTGVTINHNPRVRIRFSIVPNDGITPPFEASKTATVSRVQLPRVGDRYQVWVDADNHDDFVFASQAPAAHPQQGLRQIVDLARRGAAPTIPGPPPQAVVGELNRLNELRLTGKISAEEFASRTAAILRGSA